MKVVKLTGLFRELPHGRPDGPSLKELSNVLSSDEAQRAAAYLAKGTGYVAAPGIVRDVFDGSVIGAGPNILTDGEWAWPSDLAHYVAKYRAGLPVTLLRHMADNGWTPPESVDVQELKLEVEPHSGDRRGRRR